MRLTGEAFETVALALSDAFTEQSDFKRLARCLNKQLQDLTDPNGRNPELILALIECAEREDSLEQLVACAKKMNPSNSLLASVDAPMLNRASSSAAIVAAGQGADPFKKRLMEVLVGLDTAGMEALAGHELELLLQDSSEPEAETLFFAVIGIVRSTKSEEATAALVPIFAGLLRRRLASKVLPGGIGVDLARAQLPRIDLSELNLHDSDLAFADLHYADLTNANLWRSRAYAVNVTKAALSRANLEEARWHAAVGRNARFHDCRMVSTFLKDADLTGAEFRGSRLQGSHLERSVLTGADFEGANLADAYFEGASVDHVAALSIARSINWRSAHFDPDVRSRIEEMSAQWKGVVTQTPDRGVIDTNAG